MLVHFTYNNNYYTYNLSLVYVLIIVQYKTCIDNCMHGCFKLPYHAAYSRSCHSITIMYKWLVQWICTGSSESSSALAVERRRKEERGTSNRAITRNFVGRGGS